MSAAARLTRMIDAADPDVAAAYNDAETLAEFGEWCALRLFGGTPETVAAVRRPEWCPVCKSDHIDPGEATDAGQITRACPRLPTDNPRYYGSPIYTGDRPPS